MNSTETWRDDGAKEMMAQVRARHASRIRRSVTSRGRSFWRARMPEQHEQDAEIKMLIQTIDDDRTAYLDHTASSRGLLS